MRAWVTALSVVAAAVAGVAAAEAPPEPAGYWTGAINSPVPLTLNGGVAITDVHRLQALQKDKNAVLIDVSNAPEAKLRNTSWVPSKRRLVTCRCSAVIVQ